MMQRMKNILRTCCTVAALVAGAAAFAADKKPVGTRPALPVIAPGARVIEGPGFKIERLMPVPNNRGNKAATRVIGNGPMNQTVFCRAGEDLLVTGMNLVTGGTGIVAQRGCHLRVVDSQVNAGGVALIVESGASVELQNSALTSRVGSVEAAPNARVAALGVSFAGPATLTGAEYLDRGGNLWGGTP
jgi:hypothetical protein